MVIPASSLRRTLADLDKQIDTYYKEVEGTMTDLKLIFTGTDNLFRVRKRNGGETEVRTLSELMALATPGRRNTTPLDCFSVRIDWVPPVVLSKRPSRKKTKS